MAARGDDDADLGERRSSTEPDRSPSAAGEGGAVPEAAPDRPVLDSEGGEARRPGPESPAAPRSPGEDRGSERSAAPVPAAESVPEAAPDRPALDPDEGEARRPGPQSAAAPRSPDGDPGAACPGCGAPGAPELPCGHRLCGACVRLGRQGRQGELGDGGCTVCYGARLMDSVLRTLLGVLFQGQPRRPPAGEGDAAAGDPGADAAEGGRCARHGQPFTAFCLEEEEPLCEECVDDEHDDHHCCSLQEAAAACKRELRFSLRSLREQLETLTSVRDTCQDTAAYIKSQFERSSHMLREEFEKMHQFLRDREAAAMASLREEEEEKSRRISEKMEKMADGIEGLTDAVVQTEEAVASESHLFLKNYKRASERAGYRTADPEEESGSLLDVAKHQGCLHYHVWEKMLDTFEYVPVTLDPNTASPWLSVSADLASVRACEEPQTPPPPANRERFVRPRAVLGSEGFEAGRHGWEVEVGDNTCWSLGVAGEHVGRRKDPRSGPGPGAEADGELWAVSLADGQYRASPGRGDGPIRLRRRPRRVRVLLDWERGCLTLSDAGDNGLIHRFKQRWSGPLRPYLSTTCAKHPLRIMARKVTVSAE